MDASSAAGDKKAIGGGVIREGGSRQVVARDWSLSLARGVGYQGRFQGSLRALQLTTVVAAVRLAWGRPRDGPQRRQVVGYDKLITLLRRPSSVAERRGEAG